MGSLATTPLPCSNSSVDEVFENREQIEISRYYERLPKPTLIATKEFEEGRIFFRDGSNDQEELEDQF